MALTLTIENETLLPDGGPLSITVSGKRGIDIGRDQYLDWTLPDPTRTISGKHCEIRFRDDAYWLHDVSTNGTFINGGTNRISGPHRLRHGDRLEIGHYIVVVSLQDEQAVHIAVDQDAPLVPHGDELWAPSAHAPPPIPRSDLRNRSDAPFPAAEFPDWAADPLEMNSAPPRQPDLKFDETGHLPLPQSRQNISEGAFRWSDDADAPGASAHERHQHTRQPPSSHDAMPPAVSDVRSHNDAQASSAEAQRIRARFAKGARIPVEALGERDVGDLAEELGALMHIVARDLKRALQARTEAKRLTSNANQTSVQAIDNNPLKFLPTAEDALRVMFDPNQSGYLDATRTLESSFKELIVHQIKTYSAMQHAARLLAEDISPDSLAGATEPGGKFQALLGSHKARLWDLYSAYWNATVRTHENGLVDVFMRYFTQCYDQSGRR